MNILLRSMGLILFQTLSIHNLVINVYLMWQIKKIKFDWWESYSYLLVSHIIKYLTSFSHKTKDMTNLPKLNNNISSKFHTHTSILKSSSWILHFALHLYFCIYPWKYNWFCFFSSMFPIIQKLHTQIKCRANIYNSTISFYNNTIAMECKTFQLLLHY